jgi:hypothetical protein
MFALLTLSLWNFSFGLLPEITIYKLLSAPVSSVEIVVDSNGMW